MLCRFCAGFKNEIRHERLLIGGRRHVGALKVGESGVVKRLERGDDVVSAGVIDGHNAERFALRKLEKRYLAPGAGAEIYPQLALKYENDAVFFHGFEDDVFAGLVAAEYRIFAQALAALFTQPVPKR